MSEPAVDRTPEVTAFHAAAEWTGVHSSDEDEWLKLRKTMLTASDFAKVLGVVQRDGCDAYSVFMEKTVGFPKKELTIEDAMFWGQVLEQPILTTVAKYHGWDYRPGGALLRSRKYPFIGATLDAEIDRHDGLGWLPEECKNSEIHKDWDPETENCPLHVMVQCQSQLLVTDAPEEVCFALLSRYRPVQIVVKPDRAFHQVLIERGEEFMERVRKLDAPPASPFSGETLKKLYPLDDGTMMTLPKEAVEWTKELDHIASEMKRLELREKELKNLIKQLMGSTTFGVLPEAVGDKKVWRWLHQANGARVLRLMKDATFPGQKAGKAPTTTVNKVVAANDVSAAITNEAPGLIMMPGAKRR